MAKTMKFDIDDDTEGDMIDVFLGKPYPTVNSEVDLNYVLRFDPKTKKLVGLIIHQFSTLFPNARDAKERRLIAEALFKLFERLHREKALRKSLVA